VLEKCISSSLWKEEAFLIAKLQQIFQTKFWEVRFNPHRLMWAPQTQLWIVRIQFTLSCLQFTIIMILDQCSPAGLPPNPRVSQNMQWGSVSFKGSMRVLRFLGEMIFASVCWSVIMKFFRSPCRIQTPGRPVSYIGGWAQNRRQKVFNWAALQFCGEAFHLCGGLVTIKLTKTPLIYSVSRFNLGVWSFVRGLSPPKTPVATGLSRLWTKVE